MKGWGILRTLTWGFYCTRNTVVDTWAEKRKIRIAYIQPGKPQQNAYIERYNRTVRYDWLGHYIFDNVDELREHATRWLWTYNNERPNTAIGGITPMQKLRNTERNSTINYC